MCWAVNTLHCSSQKKDRCLCHRWGFSTWKSHTSRGTCSNQQLRAVTGGSNRGRDLLGICSQKCADQYVEVIDHCPSNCQSLNYNNWWCAYICQWWETPSACLIPRPQRTSLTHVWVVVFNFIFFWWKYYASLCSPTSTTAVFLRLQFDGPSTSRAFDAETVCRQKCHR